MTIQKFSFQDSDLVIWAEPANLNYFLQTPIEPDVAGGVTNVTTNVKAHTRRQYVQDPTTINVSATTREYMVDPGRKMGTAIPGKPFICDDGVERRQMRYTGDFLNLHAFFTGDAGMDLSLYSPTGTRYSIAAVEAGNVVLRK